VSYYVSGCECNKGSNRSQGVTRLWRETTTVDAWQRKKCCDDCIGKDKKTGRDETRTLTVACVADVASEIAPPQTDTNRPTVPT